MPASRSPRSPAEAATRAAGQSGRVAGGGALVVETDRGPIEAPLIVDALGWRRVLGSGPVVQPPEAPISRGLEVHPEMPRHRHRPRRLDRPLARAPRLRLVGARPRPSARRRGLLRAAPPRQGADARHRRPPGRRRGPLPGQLVPAPAAPGRRGRRVLRRRLGRALPPPVGRGDPDGVLLRHRLRAGAPGRAGGPPARPRRRSSATARSRPPTRARTRSRSACSAWSRACRRAR